MSAKTLLTLLFLASLCVVAILGLRALPQRIGSDKGATADEVLVAATALPAGTLLRAKDITWQKISGAAEAGQIPRPAGSEAELRARTELYGAALRVAATAGDPLTRAAIVKPGDRDFLQIVLSAHARAIAIPVVTGGASTGILYPGDRVDVILTQTFKNDPLLTRRSVGETVVENLRVLAIDPPDAKPAGSGSNFGRTVTLEVTPEQAEKINVAAELGKLSLTLRSTGGMEVGKPAEATGPIAAAAVRPIWAGDVSPALGNAIPAKPTGREAPAVEILRGSKAAAVRSR